MAYLFFSFVFITPNKYSFGYAEWVESIYKKPLY